MKRRQMFGGRYATLAVCMSEAQAEGIRMAARVAGMSTSRYLNGLIADKLAEVASDEPLDKQKSFAAGQASEARYAAASPRAAMPPKALSVQLRPVAGTSEEIGRMLLGDPIPGRSALDRRNSL